MIHVNYLEFTVLSSKFCQLTAHACVGIYFHVQIIVLLLLLSEGYFQSFCVGVIVAFLQARAAIFIKNIILVA